MDTDLKKIKKTAALMKKMGILVMKTPEIELHLSPAAVFHEEKESLPEEKGSTPEDSQYSEEDVLLWSAPGLMSEEVQH